MTLTKPADDIPGTNRSRHRVWTAALAILVPAAMTGSASAHVKWFTKTNVDTPPHPLGAVLTANFFAILAVAIGLVFFGFILDGIVARRWPRLTSSGIARAPIEQRLVRAATGAYFIYTSGVGGTILTPELTSHAPWVGITQFMIALFVLWRPTCVLSGLGILLLYGDSIVNYGAFHLTDYVFFPGLAVYLASLALPWPGLARIREPILTASLAFSLAWTAIEKFLYPQWARAVVALHPSVAMGVPSPLMVTVAGFVEFTLAFYLITGRGLLRLGGLAYLSIFMAAMPEFGRLDVFGHLIIIAILSITALRGTTQMQNRLHTDGRSLVADSGRIVLLYLGSLIAFFAMYYAMQRT